MRRRLVSLETTYANSTYPLYFASGNSLVNKLPFFGFSIQLLLSGSERSESPFFFLLYSSICVPFPIHGQSRSVSDVAL